MFCFVEELPNYFSQWLLDSLTSRTRGLQFLPVLVNSNYSLAFDFKRRDGCRVVAHCDFDLCFCWNE